MHNEFLFRFINATLKNPLFDWVIPIFSDKDLVLLPGAIAAGLLLFFGGKRTRVFIIALLPALALADAGAVRMLKESFNQPRPYTQLGDVHLHRGDSWTLAQPDPESDGTDKSLGFPSAHAANAAAAALVLAFLSRKTLWFTLPLALLIGFSRVYTGHHYPGDVLGGYAWGAVCGTVSAWLSLRFVAPLIAEGRRHASWEEIHPARRTFYLLLGAWTLFNYLYVHANLFDLSGDEAQYWDWSRRLALGYYSKPPMVAYVIAIVTSAGGNEEWAIRTGAIIFASLTVALVYALTLRIAKRERTALLAAMVFMAMPATWAGSVLMTTDPLLCFFFAAALYTFHRAVNGESRFWWLVGLSLGLGTLSKYTMVLIILAFVGYLLVVDRRHWRTRGPYLAMAVCAVCLTGVVYWNWSHDWVSFRHTASIGARDAWNAMQAARSLATYVVAQLGVVSPVLFALMLGLLARNFRRLDPGVALLAMAFVVVFGAYAIVSLTHKTELNWPIAAYIAGAPALAILWHSRDRGVWATRLLAAGLVIGCVMGAAARSTELIYTVATQPNPPDGSVYIFGKPFNPESDPTNALRGGRELGAALSKYMQGDAEQRPFPFSDRYPLTAWAAFYTSGRPRAYCMNAGTRRFNQYDLWNGWDALEGRDGLFVTGGNLLKTHMFIHYMVAHGYFESGELIEIVTVRRSGIIVRKFSISMMRGYTGKAWAVDAEEY
jgi:membrane-associated phospholipid phosphatase